MGGESACGSYRHSIVQTVEYVHAEDIEGGSASYGKQQIDRPNPLRCGRQSGVHLRTNTLDGKVATIKAETNILVACMNMTPLAFQVIVINEDWISPKVMAMMKKMNYEPRTGLERKKNGISKLPDFKRQTSKKRLGYNPATDKGKKTIFISKGLSEYQGQFDEWECNRIKKLGFEIFTDMISSMGKEQNQTKEEETISIAEI